MARPRVHDGLVFYFDFVSVVTVLPDSRGEFRQSCFVKRASWISLRFFLYLNQYSSGKRIVAFRDVPDFRARVSAITAHEPTTSFEPECVLLSVVLIDFAIHML